MHSYDEAVSYAKGQVAHASQNWTNQCQHFSRNCVGAAAWAPSAREAFNAIPSAHRHTSWPPPAGALVYWGVSDHGFGHATFVGDGVIYSTDFKRQGKVDAAKITKKPEQMPFWGLPYRGWIDWTPSGAINLKGTAKPAPPKPKPTPVSVIKGVDYSFSRPSVTQLYKDGYRFVVRYVSGGTSSKDLTTAEYKDIKAAGLQLCLVWEASGGAAKGGNATGVEHGKAAVAQLKALGLTGHPVYFAVDYDAESSSELAAVVAYVKGAASILGHDATGVYGGEAAVKAVMDSKACRYAWQTYAWTKNWDSRAQLRQIANSVVVAGGTVDLCEAHSAAYGQAAPTAAPTPVPPKPKPTPVPAITVASVQPLPGATPVRLVQQALNKVGLKCPVDGVFCSETQVAYSKWQQSLGYTGADANGAPGKISLTKLGAKTGLFTVAS